jgi:uncharacterized protein
MINTKNNSKSINSAYDIASHKDFHVFEFKNKFYLFDIENVIVYEIEIDLYKAILGNDESYVKDILLSSVPENFTNKVRNVPEHKKQEPLTNISLNVAQVCNLSCVYCYGVDGEYGLKGKMNLAVAKKSIDFLIKESEDQKYISITFFGGEPLLNFPLIQECVSYSRIEAHKVKKEISFSITTNGTKFNKEINEYLNSNNFSVIVSFDGDKETQDKNRPTRGGKGSYDSTLPKIKEFLDSRNGKATARATVTNHTVDLSNLTKKLKEIGFNNAFSSVATVSDYASKNRGVESIGIEDEQMKRIFETEDNEARRIFSTVKNRGALNELSGSKIWNFLMQLKTKNKSYHPCGVGRKMVGIAINGDVYPCHRFVGEEKFKLGNVSNFDSDKRAKYSKSYTKDHPVCSKCWAKYQCGGAGCIQDNEVMMGDIKSLNLRYCTELKYQLKHAIHIYNSLEVDDLNYLFS